MKRLLQDLRNFEGNTLCIGVTDKKIISVLKSNKKVGLYELSRPVKRKFFSKSKRIKTDNGKSVKIKKFRSLFKKKSIEYIIIDLNNLYDYYKYLAANSIYVCNTKVYIYGHSDYLTGKDVAAKFKRYKTEIECIQVDDNYLVIVDVSQAKYRWLKNKYYLIIDTFHNLGDYISYFLTS